MDLVSLLIVLIVFGVLFWLVSSVIPLQPPLLRTCAIIVLAIIFIAVLLGYVPMTHLHIER